MLRTKEKILKTASSIVVSQTNPLELVNVITHFFIVFGLMEMCRDPAELFSLLLVTLVGMVDSIMYHLMALLDGYYGVISTAQWNLADHVTAQGLIVIGPVFFLGISDLFVLHGYVFFLVVIFAVLVVILDVMYFAVALAGFHLVLSVFLQWNRWALAIKDLDLTWVIILLASGFVCYFLDYRYYYATHPVWHFCSLFSIWPLLRIRHKYFGFGAYSLRSEFYKAALREKRSRYRETVWHYLPSFIPYNRKEEWSVPFLTMHPGFF